MLPYVTWVSVLGLTGLFRCGTRLACSPLRQLRHIYLLTGDTSVSRRLTMQMANIIENSMRTVGILNCRLTWELGSLVRLTVCATRSFLKVVAIGQ